MSWNKPVLDEISCGTEINMYFPAGLQGPGAEPTDAPRGGAAVPFA